ncbi:hypothetical protein QE422_001835 [Chryseobacterium sp. SORGH_AS 447]|nr:hypothetical protein [Chryseobacterium sp. SORGH_AS_0447]
MGLTAQQLTLLVICMSFVTFAGKFKPNIYAGFHR